MQTNQWASPRRTSAFSVTAGQDPCPESPRASIQTRHPKPAPQASLLPSGETPVKAGPRLPRSHLPPEGPCSPCGPGGSPLILRGIVSVTGLIFSMSPVSRLDQFRPGPNSRVIVILNTAWLRFLERLAWGRGSLAAALSPVQESAPAGSPIRCTLGSAPGTLPAVQGPRAAPCDFTVSPSA